MEPLWLCRDNFIRTSVRKVSGWTDKAFERVAKKGTKAFERVAWEDAQVLILLPPSEKKNSTTKPTPAINVYTGVLYQALDWASLSAAA